MQTVVEEGSNVAGTYNALMKTNLFREFVARLNECWEEGNLFQIGIQMGDQFSFTQTVDPSMIRIDEKGIRMEVIQDLDLSIYPNDTDIYNLTYKLNDNAYCLSHEEQQYTFRLY